MGGTDREDAWLMFGILAHSPTNLCLWRFGGHEIHQTSRE